MKRSWRPGGARIRLAALSVAPLLLAAAPGTVGVRAGTPGAAAGGQASEDAEVLDELRRYYEALSTRDWDAFRDHFWPGATLTTVWQPPGESAPRVVVSTLDDFIAAAPLGPGSKAIFEEWMTGAEITRRGDLAQVWARYGARFGDPGDVMEWTGIDAFTLVRHEGRWRIVSLAYVGDEGPG